VDTYLLDLEIQPILQKNDPLRRAVFKTPALRQLREAQMTNPSQRWVSGHIERERTEPRSCIDFQDAGSQRGVITPRVILDSCERALLVSKQNKSAP
jgi:hypothetical protein